MTGERDRAADGRRGERRAAGPFASPSQKMLAIVAGLFVGLVAASILRDAFLARTHTAPPPRPAAMTSLANGVTAFQMTGRDTKGRAAAFEVLLPGADIAWSPRAMALLAAGKPIDAANLATALPGALTGRLAGAQHVIVASAVKGSVSQSAEVHRAGLQAALAAKLVAQLAPPTTPVWSLNLGGYDRLCAACEARAITWPGAFFVVLVRDADKTLRLAEAVADALSAKTNIPSPSAFNAFALTRVR